MIFHFIGKEQSSKRYTDLPKVLPLRSNNIESGIWFSRFLVKNPLQTRTEYFPHDLWACLTHLAWPWSHRASSHLAGAAAEPTKQTGQGSMVILYSKPHTHLS